METYMLNLIHMRKIPKSHALQVCNRMKFKKNEVWFDTMISMF